MFSDQRLQPQHDYNLLQIQEGETNLLLKTIKKLTDNIIKKLRPMAISKVRLSFLFNPEVV